MRYADELLFKDNFLNFGDKKNKKRVLSWTRQQAEVWRWAMFV